VLKEHLIITKILFFPKSFFTIQRVINTITTTMDQKLYYSTIGKVTMEKLGSLQSKMHDDTATTEDRQFALLLQEIVSLAKNRLSVAENESEFSKGCAVWVERTATHNPHIRLHGGALEDDPIRS
jgi:uncharacterized protein YjfI (DUF2170 family)